MPEIVNVIKQEVPKYNMVQWFVVADRDPKFIYRRQGHLLIAEDDGWHSCYLIRPGETQAFGGRNFELDMEDGSKFQCNGQAWYTLPPNHEAMYHFASATMDELKKCYVFCSASIDKSKVDKWLEVNEPFVGYREFEQVVKVWEPPKEASDAS